MYQQTTKYSHVWKNEVFHPPFHTDEIVKIVTLGGIDGLSKQNKRRINYTFVAHNISHLFQANTTVRSTKAEKCFNSTNGY